jgi:hypothetical protein
VQVSQLTDMRDMFGAGALKVTFYHCNSGAVRCSKVLQEDMHVIMLQFVAFHDSKSPCKITKRIHKKHLK